MIAISNSCFSYYCLYFLSFLYIHICEHCHVNTTKVVWRSRSEDKSRALQFAVSKEPHKPPVHPHLDVTLEIDFSECYQ